MRVRRFVEHGYVIGTIRSDDLAHNIDKAHDYAGSAKATRKEFR
jgi:hypothetical protein